MEYQVHQEVQGSPAALESQGQQDPQDKGEMSVHPVCLARGNQDRMAYLDSQAYQVERVIQDPLVCLENPVCQGLVSQGSQDQRVIREWEDFLEDQGPKAIKVMVVYLVCLDPLDQLAHLVPLGLWVPLEELVPLDPKGRLEREGQRVLKEVWVSKDHQGYLVRMVSLERMESLGLEDHLVN